VQYEVAVWVETFSIITSSKLGVSFKTLPLGLLFSSNEFG
jgi:hypothetical protein